jgi:hypothetical protein
VCALLVAIAPDNGVAATTQHYPSHMLRKIHKARNRTWYYQDLTGHRRTPYHHWADRVCKHPNCRYWALRLWKHRARQARSAYHRWLHAGGVPADVRSVLLCIHPYEEPSWSTSAGGLGFVYPPSVYNIGITDSLAARYGDSWYGWPVNAQLLFAYQLVRKYGYSPWSTAYHCA